jgi:hypothetical protein
MKNLPFHRKKAQRATKQGRGSSLDTHNGRAICARLVIP